MIKSINLKIIPESIKDLTKIRYFFKIGRHYNIKIHQKFVPADHWYLQTLGVDPIHQGKGCGSFLMEYISEKINSSKLLPIFLETSTEMNVYFIKVRF